MKEVKKTVVETLPEGDQINAKTFKVFFSLTVATMILVVLFLAYLLLGI